MQLQWLILTLFFYSTISFSQGYYLEYKISGDKYLSGALKIFYQNGVSRTDMKFQPKEMKMAAWDDLSVLFFEKDPNKIYLVNNDTKTYSEISTANNEEWTDYDEKDYEITIVGPETVNNYRATHVVVKVKTNSQKQDLWMSKEVPAYKDYYAIKSKYTGKINLYNALSKKGVEGFPVRMIVKEKNANMQIDLVKAEKRPIATNLLSLEGYQKGSSMPGVPKEIDVGKLQNFQNLSPEEQRKIMEEMRRSFEQNGKPPKN